MDTIQCFCCSRCENVKKRNFALALCIFVNWWCLWFPNFSFSLWILTVKIFEFALFLCWLTPRICFMFCIGYPGWRLFLSKEHINWKYSQLSSHISYLFSSCWEVIPRRWTRRKNMLEQKANMILKNLSLLNIYQIWRGIMKSVSFRGDLFNIILESYLYYHLSRNSLPFIFWRLFLSNVGRICAQDGPFWRSHFRLRVRALRSVSGEWREQCWLPMPGL